MPAIGVATMPDKRRDKKVPAVAEEVETKPVRVELAPEIHGALRRVAAEEGLSMAALARRIISEYAQENDPRRGRR
jgi:hypothetical protein